MAIFNDGIRLPTDVERGASGGPGFNTSVIVLSSGFERRNKNWEETRGRWNISYGISTAPLLEGVIDTFYVVQGMADGFRFKDFSDFRIGKTTDITTRQNIGTTDGTDATYQIFKRYTRGAVNFDRTITKVVASTARVWVNAVEITEGGGAGEFAINNNTGVVTIGSTLAAQSGTAVEVICEFDVPVRFASDNLNITTTVFTLDEAVINLPAINIMEVRI